MSEWKIRRGEQEFPVPSLPTLKTWTVAGRVQRDDYVFNPILDRWMFAHELPELAPIFASKAPAVAPVVVAQPRGRMGGISCGCAVVLFLLTVLLATSGMEGGVIALLLVCATGAFALVGVILLVARK